MIKNVAIADSIEPHGPIHRVTRVLRNIIARITAVFLWLVTGVAGLLFVAAGIHGVGNPTSGYVPVTATVLECKTWVTRGDPTTSSRNLNYVKVGLHYRYRVGEKPRLGVGLLDIGRSGSANKARDMEAGAAATFAAGRPVQVFVDPDDPARSTLERKGRIKGLPALLFGVIFLLMAIVTPVVSAANTLRRRRELGKVQIDRWLNAVVIVIMVGLALSALAWGVTNEPRSTAIVVAFAVIGAVQVAARVWRGRARSRAPEHGGPEALD